MSLASRAFLASVVFAFDPAAPVRSLARRPPITVDAAQSLRDVVQVMARAEVGRVIVVDRAAPRQPIGILTRSDIIAVDGGRRGAGGS